MGTNVLMIYRIEGITLALIYITKCVNPANLTDNHFPLLSTKLSISFDQTN